MLSPSAKSYDRGSKFARYARIDSLTDYLLVAQDRPSVELYSRRDDGEWDQMTFTDLRDRVHIPSIGCSFVLSEVYEDVEFSAEA